VLVNFYTKKYITFFEDVKDVLQKAYKGNYSARVNIRVSEELNGNCPLVKRFDGGRLDPI